MRQTRFKPLTLRGREKTLVSTLDRLCNMPGCNKYINAGDDFVRWGSYQLHVNCAGAWCANNGVEANYGGLS